jgi:hypothetical protein
VSAEPAAWEDRGELGEPGGPGSVVPVALEGRRTVVRAVKAASAERVELVAQAVPGARAVWAAV